MSSEHDSPEHESTDPASTPNPTSTPPGQPEHPHQSTGLPAAPDGPPDPRPALWALGTCRADGMPEVHALPAALLPSHLQPPDADHAECANPAPVGGGMCALDDDHDPRADDEPHACWGETDGLAWLLEWRDEARPVVDDRTVDTKDADA